MAREISYKLSHYRFPKKINNLSGNNIIIRINNCGFDFLISIILIINIIITILSRPYYNIFFNILKIISDLS